MFVAFSYGKRTRRRYALLSFVTLCFLLLASRSAAFGFAPGPAEVRPYVYLPLVLSQSGVRFAVIGDYGSAGTAERDVAALVKSWNPDFVITVGDNNYPNGSASTIDSNIGQYYSVFIGSYTGQYGAGAAANLFFPSLGNHDWVASDATPYRDYFSLPGNERYYDVVWGPVHLFAIDSDPNEPDGVSSTSTQAQWLQSQLGASTSCWDLVYMHHPPYSSGDHGSSLWMQWPYGDWGADVVLAGHDHTYERILKDGVPYFVNGLGGRSIYNIGSPIDGSQFRFNDDYGAMLVEATDGRITFTFIARTGTIVDSYTMNKSCTSVSAPAGEDFRTPSVRGPGGGLQYFPRWRRAF